MLKPNSIYESFFRILFLCCMPRSVPGVADFCGLLLLGLAVFFTAAFLAGDGPSPLAASLLSVAALVGAARFLVVLAAGATTVFDLGFAAAFDFGAAAALGFVRPRAIITKTGYVLTII